MNRIATLIEGLYILKTINLTNNRDYFQKSFNKESFIENNLGTNFSEIYYSISEKLVIRDLLKKSKNYKLFFYIELDDASAQYLYISKGLNPSSTILNN